MAKRKSAGNGLGRPYKRESDGRWCAALVLPTGTRKVFYGRTAQQAVNKRDEAKSNLRQGKPVTPEKQRLSDFLEGWLKDTAKPSVRLRTYEFYAEIIHKHISPSLGRISLGTLTPQDIQAFINEKLATGLSPRRVQHMHAVLRNALAQAERWNLVHRNVAKLVSVPHVKDRKAQPYGPGEQRALLKAIEGHRHEYLYLVAVATGARQGELLGLAWDAVDLAHGSISIRQTLERSDHGRTWALAECKTDKSNRTLRLPQIATNALMAQKLRQTHEREKAGSLWENRDNLVFTEELGGPLSGVNVTHALHRLQDKAGLRRQRFHDLRHLAASIQLAQGASLREVMEMLGHSTIALTANLYTHVAEAMKADAAARMDKALTFEPG